jgi:hypothetical protein
MVDWMESIRRWPGERIAPFILTQSIKSQIVNRPAFNFRKSFAWNAQQRFFISHENKSSPVSDLRGKLAPNGAFPEPQRASKLKVQQLGEPRITSFSPEQKVDSLTPAQPPLSKFRSTHLRRDEQAGKKKFGIEIRNAE